MKYTLIVTGAGASVDCLAPSLYRRWNVLEPNPEQAVIAEALKRVERYFPPLTTNLIESLRFHSKGCGLLLEALDDKLKHEKDKSDFEGALRQIFLHYGERFKGEFLELRKAIRLRMVQADEIGEYFETLYSNLFGRLKASYFGKDREFLVVNLNYDRLAEFAITNRYGFREIAQFGESENGFHLYHPHGSCSWTQSARSPSMTIMPIVGTNRFKLAQSSKCQLRHGDNDQLLGVGDRAHTNLVPAIALPMSGDMEGKTVWPEDQFYSLIEKLPDVDSVIVIGWRAADDHIVDLIADKLGNVSVAHLVGMKEPIELKQNLLSWNLPDQTTHLISGGFRAYLAGTSRSSFRDLLLG